MEDANNTCDKKIAHNTENIEYTEKCGKLQEIMEYTLSKPLGVDCQYCDKNQNDCVCCDCGERDCDECAKPLWVTVCCDEYVKPECVTPKWVCRCRGE